jgi:hypothetical protein
MKKKLQWCWSYAQCLALVPAICVSKLPHRLALILSAHQGCANTTEEKKTSILEEEKSFAE